MSESKGSIDHYRCYIHGEWVDTDSTANIEVENPANEEVFATVPACTQAEAEAALAFTNARNDGLSAYLFTRDYTRFMHAIDNMQVGTIFINKQIVGYIQGYHSGHKRSGLDGEDGTYGIEGYLQKRTIYLSYDH
jgi:lactaldehyde dehydrogenase/glycolaldehyde dehydrogenase